jgi:hypothetical protein
MWPFTKKDPKQELWAWFAKNGSRFRDPRSMDQDALHRLDELLKAVQPGLVFEFTVRDGNACELSISANGDTALFGAVVDVVNSAPEIQGWKINAFRQASAIGARISMGGLKLGPEDIWFRHKPDGPATAVVFHVRGICEENHEQVQTAVFVLVDNALGELASATGLGQVGFSHLPEDPAAAGLRPFTDLPAVVQPVLQ